MQSKGRGLVIAKPYWLFSSILVILDENRLTSPAAVLNKTFSCSTSFKKISVSKASLVLTQLYPPIRVFSKILTTLSSRGSTILHLLCFYVRNQKKHWHCYISQIKFKKLLQQLRSLFKNFAQNQSVFVCCKFCSGRLVSPVLVS